MTGLTKIVMFDLEDTLVRTEGPITVRELRDQTKRKLLELGIPRRVISKTDKATIMRNEANKYVEKFLDEKQHMLFKSRFDEFMEGYELGAAQNSVLFDDTVPALRQLKEKEVTMAMVTNTSKVALATFLSKHQIKEFFEVIVTRDDTRMLKPNPEGIQLALRRLHARPPFFFVGDSEFDITAAKRANGISILICRSRPNQSKKLADYTIPSLLEIPKIVNESRLNGLKIYNTTDK